MKKRLLVLGASGHAKEIVSLARLLGYDDIVLATSDGSGGFWGIDVVMIDQSLSDRFEDWHVMVGIGDNEVRCRLLEQFAEMRLVSLVAPTAVIGEGVRMGVGCYVGAQAYVGADSMLGNGVLVNVGAVIGHDCAVGHGVQLGPGATVLGGVVLGDRVLLGAGAVVNHGSSTASVEIAEAVHVGMGVMVAESIDEKGARVMLKPNKVMLGGGER